MAHALILATNRLTGRLRAATGTDLAALAPLNGRPVLHNTLDALRRSRTVDEIVVVGPTGLADAVPGFGDVRWFEEGRTRLESLRLGMRGLGLSTPVVVAAADLPFLTPESVDALVDALPDGVDVGLPAITSEEFRTAFPAEPTAEVRLSDGWFVVPGAAVVKPQAVMMNLKLILRACRSRRPLVRALRLFGVVTAVGYLMGRLSTDALCASATRRLAAPCQALRGLPPELAFTLRSLQQYEIARGRASGARHVPHGDEVGVRVE